MHEAYRRYGHSKSFHCNSCDSRLICPRAACRNTECPLLGVTPKRCKASKRTTIHFLQIEPQLSLILGRILSRLIQTHRQIHAEDDSGKRSETYSFPWYKRFIETHTDFDECKINIILTINFDGVKLKKLSRSVLDISALAVANLAYLPSHRRSAVQGEKQGRKHSIGWQTFSKKTPQKLCCEKCFLGQLRSELEALLDSGIPIVVDDRTWFCTPVLSKGVIDFSALKTLYDLPRWQSQNGCHLCTFEGERRCHRVIWFPRFPYAGDRRTFASITRDAITRWCSRRARILNISARVGKERRADCCARCMISQECRNCFLLRKEAVDQLVKETEQISNEYLDRLNAKITAGDNLSHRLCKGNKKYSSAVYKKKTMDTVQEYVYLEVNGVPQFGQVIIFAFDSWTNECRVLLRKFDRGPVHSTRSSPGQQPTQCHLQSTLCPLRYSSL
ncbi:hypothetical protein COOONC_21196 [Cooperia oncophora]